MTDATQLPLAVSAAAPLAPAGAPPDIMGLMALAVQQGGNIETIERLTDLYHRIEDRRAASEFTLALKEFQERCPEIKKNKSASFPTKLGGDFSYTYANLTQVCRTVNPLLHPLGLSYKWDSAVSDDGGRLKVTCTLSHVAGHSVTAAFESPIDKGHGTSAAQDYAKVQTYGQRQSLIQVCGIFSADEDLDAAKAPVKRISDNQLAELEDLLTETKMNRAKLLELGGAASLGELRLSQFPMMKELLVARLEKMRAKA